MKNVKIILLFLISAPTIVHGQLNGTFCHSFGFGSECITFGPNNRFEYANSHCTGAEEGKGIYTLQESSLVLQFETDSSKLVKEIIIEKMERTKTDSVTIEVSVFDAKNRDPLPFAHVYLSNESPKLNLGIQTDLDGQGKLKFLKSIQHPTVNIHYIGFKTVSTKIRPRRDYKISVYLVDGYAETYDSSKKITYIVEYIRDHSISLKGTYPNALFSTYKKK